MQFFIFYLKMTQAGMKIKPHLNNHFVLTLKDKFFILSSQPVNGLKSTYIHTPNIKGFQRSQYVIEHLHTFDAKYHIFQNTLQGMNYLNEHREKFKPVLQALQNLVT